MVYEYFWTVPFESKVLTARHKYMLSIFYHQKLISEKSTLQMRVEDLEAEACEWKLEKNGLVETLAQRKEQVDLLQVGRVSHIYTPTLRYQGCHGHLPLVKFGYFMSFLPLQMALFQVCFSSNYNFGRWSSWNVLVFFLYLYSRIPLLHLLQSFCFYIWRKIPLYRFPKIKTI